MKIKNVRQFLSYYKKIVRDIDSSKRNENFIGSKYINGGDPDEDSAGVGNLY